VPPGETYWGARPVRHALVLGAVGLALATLGGVAMRGVGPAWYPLALVALALPTTWAGAKLYVARDH
jgi:hypothetical protein